MEDLPLYRGYQYLHALYTYNEIPAFIASKKTDATGWEAFLEMKQSFDSE